MGVNTEEQTVYDGFVNVGKGAVYRYGQKLTISDRLVSKVGFWLNQSDSPAGTVTLAIYKVSDGSTVASKLWGDASSLPLTVTYEDVTFDTPVLINEEVYIAAVSSLVQVDNNWRIRYQASDVASGEVGALYTTVWADHTGYDCAYRYSYYNRGLEAMGAGLKTRLETISDLERVFGPDELPNAVNECPAALILPGETEYNQTFTNKIDVLFRVLILVAKQDNPSAYNRLLDYMTITGDDSVYAAIAADQTLDAAADAAFVTKCSGAGATIWGGHTYLSTEFEVVAYG